MVCAKCGSTNVQAVAITSGKVHGGSFMRSLGRFFLIVFTMGLWLFVSKGRGKIKTKTEFVCLNCGAKVKP